MKNARPVRDEGAASSPGAAGLVPVLALAIGLVLAVLGLACCAVRWSARRLCAPPRVLARHSVRRAVPAKAEAAPDASSGDGDVEVYELE